MRKLHRTLGIFGLIAAILCTGVLCAGDMPRQILLTSPPETTAPTFSTESMTPTEPVEATVPTDPAPTEPPMTQPPITEPPVTEPPVTDPPPTEPPPPPVDPPSAYLGTGGFLWDVTAGEALLVNGDLNARQYPASITKLFSIMVALDYLDPAQEITVGEELALVRPGSSVAWLAQGCRLTVEALIQAMLLPSGNDAAQTLAVAAGRAAAQDPDLAPQAAVDRFVQAMNEKAAALGLENTHFANPDGYHHPEHYTTMLGLIRIGQLALENPIIRRCASTPTMETPMLSGGVLNLYNTNLLIHPESSYYHPEAIGLKTGCTNEAGWCLLAAFQKGDRVYLVGTFGCVDNHSRMMDVLNMYNSLP